MLLCVVLSIRVQEEGASSEQEEGAHALRTHALSAGRRRQQLQGPPGFLRVQQARLAAVRSRPTRVEPGSGRGPAQGRPGTERLAQGRQRAGTAAALVLSASLQASVTATIAAQLVPSECSRPSQGTQVKIRCTD